MNKKRSKHVSFDAMVKFFMRQYNIPTKKDVNGLIAKIDRLEKLIKATARPTKSGRVSRRVSSKGKALPGKSSVTASDIVLNIIKTYRNGAGFAQIQAKTGFGEKKLRNIIFRLNHMNKIKRKSRGIYISS
ncbi:MAG: phasin family protein [Desulfobacteraceae bacterium]|nr:phasin family protein [Desulfobacteraceae bacterium]